MTRAHKLSFIFWQTAGAGALFLFGIFFAVRFIFSDQDVTAVTRAAWEALGR